jgi:hypothetical protein
MFMSGRQRGMMERNEKIDAQNAQSDDVKSQTHGHRPRADELKSVARKRR